ncbi:hypothetical protein [Massilia suwonensis]|uniref:YCII-related domain-containing protein n=1 Tax=Massilia suwonensis TaxID=648895 RepID=A0ABW0MEA7_9BURK
MLNFYTTDAVVTMYKDDSDRKTMLFVIERPATDEDIAAHAEAHAEFIASITALPEPAASPEGSM